MKTDQQQSFTLALVEDLELSCRAYNALKNANINTIGDLVQMTRADILRLKYLGRISLGEIESALDNLGLNLGMNLNSQVSNPLPTPNASTPIWDLVIADMKARDHVGRKRYGTPLQAGNGRDALQDAYEDAYEEALDLAVYLRQELEERKSRP